MTLYMQCSPHRLDYMRFPLFQEKVLSFTHQQYFENVYEDQVEVQRQPRDRKDDPDAREDERHPPVALHLALATPGVGLESGVFPAKWKRTGH